jgi:outer membrane PBP1 activator LpoA protein
MNEETEIELKKKAARAFYEEGKIDEAIEALRELPRDDDEVRELNRALRYADEARGVVSNVSPETQKYFADLAERLGISKK